MERGRLLFVLNNPAFFVSHRLPLGRRAVELGLDVALAAPDGDGRDEVEAAGIRFIPIPLTRSSARPLDEARSLAVLVRVLGRERPHLVHNVTIKPVLYGGIAARIAGVPAVVSSVSGLGYIFVSTGTRAALRREAVRVMYRAALANPRARVIFQNADDRAAMIDAGIVTSSQAILVAGGSGVDVARFAATELPPGRPLVVLPARMLRDKGIVEFVEAARALRDTGARFALVGPLDPGNPAALDARELAALTADGAAEWWGERSDMPSVLGAAHVVCLPSYREGMPKALIEAAACGRAVVTTDVPGCRDAIRVGVTGLLAAPKSTASLASTLRQTLADPDRTASMGRAGRELAEREFSVEGVVDATFEVYQQASPVIRRALARRLG